MKDKIFNNLVKEDYNDNLEKVLQNKDFSEEVKNNLLNIFYKIENGYNDYQTVKRDTFDKKEYIEKLTNIIDNNIDSLEFIETTKSSKDKVDKKNKKISCRQIDNKILYSIAKIQNKSTIINLEDKNIDKAFSDVMNIGNNINTVEPLRDFNGFSWNQIVKDIEDIRCNLIFQNMIYLLGNEFTYNWVNNPETTDYLNLCFSILTKKYGKELADDIIDKLLRLIIMIKTESSDKIYEEFKESYIKTKNELERMGKSSEYIANIYSIKKIKDDEIIRINKVLANDNKVLEEYNNRIKQNAIQDNIDINEFKNELEKEKNNLVLELMELNNLVNPSKFLKRKQILEQNIKYLELPEKELLKKQYGKDIVLFQKLILKCIEIDIQNVKDKDKIIDLLYKIRYYCFLPITSKKNTYDIKELKEKIEEIFKEISKKLLNNRIILEIFKGEENNLNIIKKILLSRIIRFEDINIKVSKEKGKEGLILFIYDEKTQEEKIELADLKKEDLKIKLEKIKKLIN